MSDDSKPYPSRLNPGQGAPVRGIGAGYAENQRLAGAANPAAAAREAVTSETERAIVADDVVRRQEDVDAMIEDIAIAIGENVIPPPANAPTTGHSAMIMFLSRRSPDEIAKLHADVQNAYDQRVQEEDDQILRAQIQNIGMLDPADPLYDPMTDRERRKAIEAKLEPISFEEMMFKGSTTQKVPLRENFTVTFRTLGTQHGLWLEWMMAQTPETSMQHTRHTYSLMLLAASLDEVNGKSIGADLSRYLKDDPTTRDSFVKAISERMEFLGRLPSLITDDLIIQSVWFQGRVRRVLAGDLMRKVGNS